jgi:Lon protease-like protein
MPGLDPLGPRSERLPVMPLRSVMFPGGRLWLTVAESRYVELMQRCQAKQRPFGALCVRASDSALESIGVLAFIDRIDRQSAAMRVHCVGGQRFRVLRDLAAGEDGLRRAKVELIDEDPVIAPVPTMFPAVQALGRALTAMRAEGRLHGDETPRFDDAAWVANRWCELLPIPLQAKQRLMELADPAARLGLVDRYLRDKRVIN